MNLTGKYRIYKRVEIDGHVRYRLKYEQKWFIIRYWSWFHFSEDYIKNFSNPQEAKDAFIQILKESNRRVHEEYTEHQIKI